MFHEGPTVLAVREIGEKARRLGINDSNNNDDNNNDIDTNIDNFRKDR